jgi:hypothetical protein
VVVFLLFPGFEPVGGKCGALTVIPAGSAFRHLIVTFFPRLRHFAGLSTGFRKDF